MNRLTDDKTAEGIKLICDGRLAEGVNPETIKSDLRYVKLAEYERIGWSPTKIKALIDWSNSLNIKEMYENERIAQQYKWISVKDRMPEDSGDYIVLNDGRIEIAPYDKEVAQEGYFPFGYEDRELDEIGNTLIDWIEISGVTHWMPLPAMPKEVRANAEIH